MFFVRCTLILSELSCDQLSMEIKRVILARFVDFYVMPTNALPWQRWILIIFLWKIHRKSILVIICLIFTFSTIFLVNNGHSTCPLSRLCTSDAD